MQIYEATDIAKIQEKHIKNAAFYIKAMYAKHTYIPILLATT